MTNQCQDCRALHEDGALITPIPDIHQRVAVGEPMPAGECPSCGALCHPVEMKPFSILLAWAWNDHEQGEFSWTGRAPDYETAVMLARRESLKLRESDSEDDMASDHVLDSMEGVHMWRAPNMLAALKAFAEAFSEDIESDEEMRGSDTVDAVCRLWPMIKREIELAECR